MFIELVKLGDEIAVVEPAYDPAHKYHHLSFKGRGRIGLTGICSGYLLKSICRTLIFHLQILQMIASSIGLCD